jgi:hypothetical protein
VPTQSAAVPTTAAPTAAAAQVRSLSAGILGRRLTPALAGPDPAAASTASHDGTAASPRAVASDGDGDGGGVPLNLPTAPFQNLITLAASGGATVSGSGGSAPGGIAVLGGLAFAIIFLVRWKRLAPDSRMPVNPSYALDSTPG